MTRHAASATATLLDLAVAGQFTTLVAAVKAAGLLETLKNKGPFTVFAPSEDAFRALPMGVLDDLLKPEGRPRLRALIRNHIVPGAFTAADLAAVPHATSLAGHELAVDEANGELTVDGGRLVATDILASNGVLHVIGSVLHG